MRKNELFKIHPDGILKWGYGPGIIVTHTHTHIYIYICRYFLLLVNPLAQSHESKRNYLFVFYVTLILMLKVE